ncbi:MAG: hypothetical protein A2X67_03950 [Ignavibacteria bacterium GWA2_55_11]|nr:MAG: hypothetical protein A2X67_03950 [Ignavibacteria bacterium GWA2_55_11]OGU45358.1 MAG: hypothetical protein A2X68_04265 [Ignavibacteria bacterium GWC2_56_12]OGU63360.1 MAG: hypothetical protein A3C56_04080 [Ignavibacteria bacterium RIFCSPHIGHO2_02_FULL_56_12]OGU69999.1 MAG: hypothetical protein A3H45_06120 [Ignavibacteria bacterium RIFCSPLOWO2_02_FULL_55_14]OGU71028.1 MAG: hypothetical protein A3G43_01930 [Ignavibacteria bacterium RIFCSPLOWO2_12_FULL_56_21]HAV24347.1 hypothetical protei
MAATPSVQDHDDRITYLQSERTAERVSPVLQVTRVPKASAPSYTDIRSIGSNSFRKLHHTKRATTFPGELV